LVFPQRWACRLRSPTDLRNLCMPPPARVCQACKACKVRCDGFVPGERPCVRCTNLGLLCEPAPQQPRVMKVADRFKPSSSSDAVGAVVALSETATPPPSTLTFRLPLPGHGILEAAQAAGPAVELFCLQSMASIARNYDRYELMKQVIRVCEEKRLALSNVLSLPAHEAATNCTPHPSEILALIGASKGFCFLRTNHLRSGIAVFGNAVFEQFIHSVELCRISSNERGECLSLFVHPDDVATLTALVTRLWVQAVCNSGVIMSSSPTAARVHYRLHGDYMASKMTLHMLSRPEQGWISGCFEFHRPKALPSWAGGLSPSPLLRALPVPRVPKPFRKRLAVESNALARERKRPSTRLGRRPPSLLPPPAERTATADSDTTASTTGTSGTSGGGASTLATRDSSSAMSGSHGLPPTLTDDVSEDLNLFDVWKSSDLTSSDLESLLDLDSLDDQPYLGDLLDGSTRAASQL